jgi:hypothetical protein
MQPLASASSSRAIHTPHTNTPFEINPLTICSASIDMILSL